jgi:G:T-mismatch repair DNA endonuclease (very short patch repair protein)
MPYRDTATLGRNNYTLAQRYEQTMTRLEQITNAGYEVEIMWECEFDRDILSKHPELRNNLLVQHTPLNTRDALYGGRTKAMSLHK